MKKERLEVRRIQRKKASVPLNMRSCLIMTEGTETEPNYFKGLVALIKETKKIEGVVNVVELNDVEIQGVGRSTTELLKETEKYVSRSRNIYQEIWLVFDKDDFKDFDDAIISAQKEGYKVAWSNECFEYWLLLHFQYLDTALTRAQLKEKLDDKLKDTVLGGYSKSCDLWKVITKNEVQVAIRNAKKRMQSFYMDKSMKYSEYNPGTYVYALVEMLFAYLVDDE